MIGEPASKGKACQRVCPRDRRGQRNRAASLLKARSNLFDPLAVHAQVGIPRARGRADMNQPGLRIEQELPIVHKSKDAAAKFDVPVRVFFDDKRGVSGRQHGLAKPGFGLIEPAGPAQRRYAMLRILRRQRRDTVGRGGARSQRARHPANVTRDFNRMPVPAQWTRDSLSVLVYNGDREPWVRRKQTRRRRVDDLSRISQTGVAL